MLRKKSAIDLMVSSDTSKNGENHEFQISSRNPNIVDDGICFCITGSRS
jgi:hypothetical protein